jgi:hypothetical protein
MPSLSPVFERATEAYGGPAIDTSWAIMIFARLGSTARPAPTDREIEVERVKLRYAAKPNRKGLGEGKLTRDRRYRAYPAAQGLSAQTSTEKTPI